MAGKLELYAWVDRAAGHVRFSHDRAGVREELRAHLEDRYDALTAAGAGEEDAAARAVAAMGDADQVGEALNKIHSPLLGWAWLLSKALLAMIAVAALVCCGLRIAELWEDRGGDWPFVRTEVNWDDVNGRRLLLAEGNSEAACGDYTLRLTRAARWRLASVEGEEHPNYICLRLEVDRPLIAPGLDLASIRTAMRITDDRGRMQDVNELAWEDPLVRRRVRVGAWEDREAPPALWYEVSYDRGGYRFTLHIDMKEEGI